MNVDELPDTMKEYNEIFYITIELKPKEIKPQKYIY